MAATLQDLILRKMTQDQEAYRRADAATRPWVPAKAPEPPQPEPPQTEPATPAWLAEAFAKLDSLSARCDALIERHGVWTRYKTGDES